MSDDSYPQRGSKTEKRQRNFFERLAGLFEAEPETQEQLLEILHSAHERALLDDDALAIIEGALQIASLKARDLMVPRAQMDGINIEDNPEEFIPNVVAISHSRFPVFEGGRDNVVGILLAKDLLRYYHNEEEFNVRDNLRPVLFVPESKPLNVLLREFRENRNHMAIVVDEYGGVAGLITIEDVLEQIVGDIEDEFDWDEEADNIIAGKVGRFRVRALTELKQFNEYFNVELAEDDIDTIGGLVTAKLRHVPKLGDTVVIDRFEFIVQRADARQVHILVVQELNDDEIAEKTQNEAE